MKPIRIKTILLAWLLVCALGTTLSPSAVRAASPNTWTTTTGSLNRDLIAPATVTLHDGRVMVIGGDYGDEFWTINPWPDPAQNPQIFDPATGIWGDTSAPPWLANPCRHQFAAVLGDGRVLVGGGIQQDGGLADPCSRSAYLYDPTAGVGGTWTSAADLPATIPLGTAVLLPSGKAFVVDSIGGNGVYGTGLIYDPADNTWTSIDEVYGLFGSQPNVTRLADGRVYVAGGFVGAHDDTGGTQIYDPVADTWTAVPVTLGALGVGTLLMPDGKLLVAGGEHTSYNVGDTFAFSRHVYLLDPATLTVVELASMTTPRAFFTLQRLPNGLILAAGGLTGSETPVHVGFGPTASAEVYDPAGNKWYPAASMSVTRAEQGSALLANGTVLVAGGNRDTSEIYTPGDIAPPWVASPTVAPALSGTVASTTRPVKLTWSGGDTGAGVSKYEVWLSTNGGSYVLVSSPTSASYTRSFGTSTTTTYRFRVRGFDKAGNVSAYVYGPTFKVSLTQQTSSAVTWSGTWSTAYTSSASGGSYRYTSTAGRSASYKFSGRSIGVVSTRGTAYGSFKVYLDGVYVGIYTDYYTSTQYRRVVYSKAWSAYGTHTIKIVCAGTSGRPRVGLDAFVVLK